MLKTSERWLVACIIVCTLPILHAAGVDPAAEAAFNRYVKRTEEGLAKRNKPANFLWLDSHRKEKSLVWMNQSLITPVKALDNGQEIETPEGIQDWLGAIYLDGATLERVRDMLLNFADYKFFFKQQVSDSRLVKRDGDRFDAFFRVHKRQVLSVVLDIDASAQYTGVDSAHASIDCRSTHIAETKRSPEDERGYLWHLNLYWRLEQADNGVYAEVELITLSRAAGSLSAERFLKGFIRNFPREFTEGLIEGLRQAFPRPH